MTDLIWELTASSAAVLFTASSFGQWLKIRKTKSTDNLSAMQWAGYTVASMVFVAFYIHLDTYIMAGVSVVGTAVSAEVFRCVVSGNTKMEVCESNA